MATLTTIEKINLDGVGVIEKAGRGETLTADDKIILKAYNTLHSGKSFRAGKRTVKNHNNNW